MKCRAKRISTSRFVGDMRAGLNNGELSRKHGIPKGKIDLVFERLVHSGAISQVEWESREAGGKSGSHDSVWKCPACGTPQDREFFVCPQCVMVESKPINRGTPLDVNLIAAPKTRKTDRSTFRTYRRRLIPKVLVASLVSFCLILATALTGKLFSAGSTNGWQSGSPEATVNQSLRPFAAAAYESTGQEEGFTSAGIAMNARTPRSSSPLVDIIENNRSDIASIVTEHGSLPYPTEAEWNAAAQLAAMVTYSTSSGGSSTRKHARASRTSGIETDRGVPLASTDDAEYEQSCQVSSNELGDDDSLVTWETSEPRREERSKRPYLILYSDSHPGAVWTMPRRALPSFLTE